MYAVSNVTGEAEILKTGPSSCFGLSCTNAGTNGVTVCFSDSADSAVTNNVHFWFLVPTQSDVSGSHEVEFRRPLRFATGFRAKVVSWTSGCSTYVRHG